MDDERSIRDCYKFMYAQEKSRCWQLEKELKEEKKAYTELSDSLDVSWVPEETSTPNNRDNGDEEVNEKVDEVSEMELSDIVVDDDDDDEYLRNENELFIIDSYEDTNVLQDSWSDEDSPLYKPMG